MCSGVIKVINTNTILCVSQCPINMSEYIVIILIYEKFAVTNMLCHSNMQPLCYDARYGKIVCA